MIRSIPQLESLRDAWDELAVARRSPLLEHDWFLSCAEAFHSERDLRIVTAESGGRLIGVAPLVHDASQPGTRLTLLGATRLYEPADWLHDSTEVAAELADRVLALGAPVLLQRVPDGSATLQAMLVGRSRRALAVARATAPSLAVRCRGNWTERPDLLSSETMAKFHRLQRKGEAAFGPMSVERVNPAPSEVDRLLESFMAVEDSGWKGRRGSSLAARADLRDFFRRYCHRAAGRRRLQVARLRFGSQIAAAEVSIDSHGRMWQLKIGYHEALSAYSPGMQLTAASVQAAFERNLDGYEFLGSAEDWQERWRPEVRRYKMLAAYPLSVAGLAGAGRDLVGSLLRRLRRQPSTQ